MANKVSRIETARVRVKSALSLGDTEALRELEKVLSRYEKAAGTLPDGAAQSIHKHNAATILSSWVLGMSRARCAQRLLDWWAVDTKSPAIDLSRADDHTRDRVLGLARRGYAALQKIERSRIG